MVTLDYQLTRKALAVFIYEQIAEEHFIHKTRAISS
ncbi:hypothetical protein PVOR_26068 [Paenibacillus vortex V453]|uniref:Uncharacterized protein n=1 Tax=Paenibacillus vortex V453 TaxID=715225 RepID=A0A2R9SPN9_9BACL|nr:hypothetical protein PVOR_26068 [Paenibacillus vortex V453]